MTLPMTGKNCSLALKWLISFAIPLIVYWAMPIDRANPVTHHMALFLSITTWAICIWAMDAMNEIAVGLILPVLYIVLCGVKQQVVYSPWLSEVPLIVIGGFALGKILQETGLGKRIGFDLRALHGRQFHRHSYRHYPRRIHRGPARPGHHRQGRHLLRHRHQLVRRTGLQGQGPRSHRRHPYLLPRRGVDQTVLPHGAARTSCSAWACCKRLPASAAHGWNTPCITSFPVCCIPSCLWGWSC